MIRSIRFTAIALLALGTHRVGLADEPAKPDPFSKPDPVGGPGSLVLTGRIVPAHREGAGAGAKYSKLLRSIEVPQDQATYGDYYDWGYYTGTSWAGFNDLPPGYWVYIAPKWHIFETCRDNAETPPPAPGGSKRPWGPEQATGAPDTLQAGDYETAWASLSPDGQQEWLDLTYAEQATPVSVMIYETHCPGAVNKVSVFDAAGTEIVVWEGQDPTTGGSGVLVVPVKVSVTTKRVKIYINSPAVPGWNEIDAVGLTGNQGNTLWASAATASSTYASPAVAEPAAPAAPRLEIRFRELER